MINLINYKFIHKGLKIRNSIKFLGCCLLFSVNKDSRNSFSTHSSKGELSDCVMLNFTFFVMLPKFFLEYCVLMFISIL
jgi:hypothetical protein